MIGTAALCRIELAGVAQRSLAQARDEAESPLNRTLPSSRGVLVAVFGWFTFLRWHHDRLWLGHFTRAITAAANSIALAGARARNQRLLTTQQKAAYEE